MKEILNLTGYEYRKIFKKRSTWIALAVVLLWTLFSGFSGAFGEFYIDGEKVDTHFHMAKQERAALEHLEIGALNDEFFQKMKGAQAEFYQGEDGFCLNGPPEGGWAAYWKRYYEANAPFENVSVLLAMMENRLGSLPREEINGTNFYAFRERMMDALFEAEKLSEGEIAFHKKENEKITTPYAYGNMTGYQNFFKMQTPNFIFIAFAVAIVLAPMFAGEHDSHMDALALSSRFGKNKLIWAKFLAGLSFAFFASVGFTLLFLLEIQAIYGLSGWNLPIQVCASGFLLNLPMNMLEFLLVSIGCCVLGILMAATVVMFLSVKMKSAFGVIILSFVFILAPVYLAQLAGNHHGLFLLVCSLPTSMFYPRGIAAHQLLSVGGHYFYFFQWVPVVYLCLAGILLCWSYRGFRDYQVR